MDGSLTGLAGAGARAGRGNGRYVVRRTGLTDPRWLPPVEPAHAPVGQTYAEGPPPPELADDVQCVWWSTFGTDAPILPDGCVDLIVGGDSALIAGPDTRPTPNTFRPRAIVRGIRFRIGRASRVLGVPVDELRDLRVSLDELYGAPGRALTRRLTSSDGADDAVGEAVGEGAGEGAGPGSALLDAVAARVFELPDVRVDPVGQQVDEAVRLLTGGGPRDGVAAALSALPVSERQLRRRFSASVGYGPATYARVARLVRVRALADELPSLGLADLAVRAGYTDQAHLSRDVRDLAGTTPRALLRS